MKKLVSQQPDVTVVVGTGENAKEFQCYSVILAHASPVLDAMLSSGMKESETGRVEFPDKNPADWKTLLECIDTSRSSLSSDEKNHILDEVINESNVRSLIPLFHELQMDRYLEKCDTVLEGGIDWHKFDWSGPKQANEIALAEAIDLLSCCSKYDVEDTQTRIEECISKLLELFLWGVVDEDTFNTSTIKQLQDVLGEQQRDKDLERPTKRQRCSGDGSLWDVITNFIDLFAISDNMMNNNEMFVNLIHYSLRSQHFKMKIQLEDVAKKLKIHSGSFFIKSNYWKRGEKTKVEHSETITVADLRAAVFSFISKNSFGCWHKMGYLIRRYELSADNTILIHRSSDKAKRGMNLKWKSISYKHPKLVSQRERITSSEKNFTVVVGNGYERKEFQCYSTILANSSSN